MVTTNQEEVDTYYKALCKNDIALCLSIERRHGLDGYPPNIVMAGLQALADGRDMYKALDEIMGC